MAYRIDFAENTGAENTGAESAGEEVRRIAAGELRAAMAMLEKAAKGDHTGFHEARKRFKKLRGLLRLMRSADRPFYDRENARIRDIARSIATVREAEAMVETADRFRAEFGAGRKNGAALERLRSVLLERRDRLAGNGSGTGGKSAWAMAECEAALAAWRDFRPDEDNVPRAIAEGVERGVRVARKAFGRARAEGGEEDFHELRKAVKYHWMHVGLVRDAWPGDAAKRRKRLKALGEILGELNDIGVLRAFLKSGEAELSKGDRGRLLDLMRRKDKALRRKCIAKARVLFRRHTRRDLALPDAAHREGGVSEIRAVARARPFSAPIAKAG